MLIIIDGLCMSEAQYKAMRKCGAKYPSVEELLKLTKSDNPKETYGGLRREDYPPLRSIIECTSK